MKSVSLAKNEPVELLLRFLMPIVPYLAHLPSMQQLEEDIQRGSQHVSWPLHAELASPYQAVGRRDQFPSHWSFPTFARISSD